MVGGDRGLVMGSIAIIGCIAGVGGTQGQPMLMAAMVMGPFSGWVIKRFDQMMDGHMPAGFEMLINNFSVGILGMLIAILGYYIIGPFMTGILTVLTYGVDILVNKAGVGGTTANMNQITMDEWNTVLATNLTAPFVLCKKVIPIMEEQGAGTIVNVASMASTAAGRGGLAYTSAKHGLLGLTRQMSLDHGRTGVRINAVLPGPIATEMIARVLAIPQHPVTMKMGMSPAKRPGEPIEVAQAIAFLASDDASFIHGAALAVDGGYTIF